MIEALFNEQLSYEAVEVLAKVIWMLMLAWSTWAVSDVINYRTDFPGFISGAAIFWIGWHFPFLVFVINCVVVYLNRDIVAEIEKMEEGNHGQ